MNYPGDYPNYSDSSSAYARQAMSQLGSGITLSELAKTLANPATSQSVSAEYAKIDEKINEPIHYARYEIEPLEFISKNKLPFCEGNVIKYTVRHDAKNGAEDLKKAVRYLTKILQDRYNVMTTVKYES